jgi:glyoxylate/hydroxypyruvate reductase
MTILFSDNSYRRDKVFALLQENMPGVDLRNYPDIGNPEDIKYAIMFRPAPGSLQNLPNLKVIFMTSAGVDAIMHDDTLPDVPIVRNTDPHLAHGIREYVVYHVLHYHRFFDRYAQQQPTQTWKQYPQLDSFTRTIGIMGLGEMGLPAAQALMALGFKVRSWSQSEKHIDGIQSFYGRDQFKEFLSGSEMLVNILPLTDQTRGILNKDLFDHLPKGAVVINIGRGPHLNEQDLIEALDSDHLSAAALDVFPVEPLPENSPLWTHPKIKITPHIASLTNYPNVTRDILNTIESFERGEQLKNIVNRTRQY